MLNAKELAQLVKETRTAQKKYFAARKAKDYITANNAYSVALPLEKRLDEEAEKILIGQEQGSLFK